MTDDFDLSTAEGRRDLCKFAAKLIVDCSERQPNGLQKARQGFERGATFEQYYPLILRRFSAVPELDSLRSKLKEWGVDAEEFWREVFNEQTRRFCD